MFLGLESDTQRPMSDVPQAYSTKVPTKYTDRHLPVCERNCKVRQLCKNMYQEATASVVAAGLE